MEFVQSKNERNDEVCECTKKRKLRVIFIPDIYEKGGAYHSFLEMVLTLSTNHDVIPIILTSKYGKYNLFAEKHGYENYVIGYSQFYISCGTTLAKRIVKFFLRPYYILQYYLGRKKSLSIVSQYVDFSEIDLIHTNFDRIDIGAIISRKYNVPHIWHIREFGEEDYRCIPIVKKYISRMNSGADMFIMISDAVMKHWVNKGINSKKTVRIYNGVSEDKCHSINHDNKKCKIVMSGLVSKEKGQLQLIKALTLMTDEERSNLEVDIYGTNSIEYISFLNAYIRIKKMDGVIRLMGHKDSLTSILPEYDIGMMCSRAEGFGRVTVEYMLCGLCVIASDSGANKEIIKDGENGFLYEYGNIIDLRETILKVMNNKSLRKGVALRAEKDANEKYTREINAKNIFDVYEKLINKNDLEEKTD